MFDAVTYSAVQKLTKVDVGTAVLAPDSFASTDFLDAGTTFLSDDYPLLGSVIAPSFNGANWTAVPIIATYDVNGPSTNGGSQGRDLACTFIGPISGDTYFVWGSGIVYRSRTSAPDVLEYVMRLTVTTTYPTIYGKATFTSNNRLYWTTNNGSATYYIDLSANENFTTTVTVTVPVAGRWRVHYNGGLYLAINTSSSGNTISSSSDGVTFTANIVTTFLATATPQDILYANGYWMIVTNGTTAATCACWSTTGLTGSWTNITLGTSGYGAVAYSSTLDMWCVSSANTLLASAFYTSAATPNTTWTARSSNVSIANSLSYFQYLVVTSDGGFAFANSGVSTPIVKSANGTAWTTVTTNNSGYPIGVAFTGNPLLITLGLAAIGPSLIAFGQRNNQNSAVCYATSDDFFVTLKALVQMTAGTPGRTSSMTSITWLADDLVGFATEYTTNSGTIVNSALVLNGLKTTDGGLTWTSISIPTSTTIGGRLLVLNYCFITATNTKFVVIGNITNGSTVYTGVSSDLVTWTWTASASVYTLSSVGAVGEQIGINANGGTFNVTNDYGATFSAGGVTLSAQTLIHRPQIKSHYVYGSVTTGTVGYCAVLMSSPVIIGGPSSGAFYFGANPITGLMVTVCSTTSTVYVSLDFGQSYTARVSPVLPVSVAVYKNWIILVTSSGSTCRSNDYGVTWVMGPYISGVPITTVNRFTLLTNPSNTKIYALGTAMVDSGNTLYISDATKRTIPPMSPPSSGFKWVVKAR
jgi:hypothetical protein